MWCPAALPLQRYPFAPTRSVRIAESCMFHPIRSAQDCTFEGQWILSFRGMVSIQFLTIPSGASGPGKKKSVPFCIERDLNCLPISWFLFCVRLGGSRIGVTMRFPDLSNCGCLPSRAGGSPVFTRGSYGVKADCLSFREKSKIDEIMNYFWKTLLLITQRIPFFGWVPVCQW